MSATRLVIDLGDFSPVHCDEALRTSLGYESDEEIRSEFLSSSHLQNMSLLQLYELGLSGQAEQVHLLNRNGRIAGTIRNVGVSHDRTRMQLDVEPSIDAQDSSTQRHLLSLRLDSGANITGVFHGDVNHPDFIGREFSRAIAPIGWATRLSRIYPARLAKNEVFNLQHATVFPDGRLHLGQWLIEKTSFDSWRADFYTHEPANEPGEKVTDYRMLVAIRGKRTEIAMDSRLLALVPVAMDVPPATLEDYLTTVLPEDRQWVRQVLHSQDLPPVHEITYRVASQDGVVTTLRHRLIQIRQGRGICRFDSRITVVPAEDIARVNLATLAIALGLAVPGDKAESTIFMPDFQRLSPYISRLKALLHADGFKTRITVSNFEQSNCSNCGRESARGNLLLELDDLRLSRNQLRKLLLSDTSMFEIGRSSGWKSWFSELHAAGFHLSIGLGDREQVTIGLFVDD